MHFESLCILWKFRNLASQGMTNSYMKVNAYNLIIGKLCIKNIVDENMYP